MVYHRIIDPRRIVKVVDTELESLDIKTIFFRDDFCRNANPGQYVMIWIPRVDEVPLSLSFIDNNGFSGVTVKKIGCGTEALFQMKKGAYIGIRGPYGNWFKLKRGKIAIIGGGIGIAPFLPLVKSLLKMKSKISLIVSGKTKNELLFVEEVTKLLKESKHTINVTTEDGSYGRKGTAIDAFEDLLKIGKFNMVYTCGPEPMVREVFTLAESHDIPLQACMERIIRCSIGLCGSCVIGQYRVCKEGLILSSEQLRNIMDEVGKYKRDFDGSKIYF